MPREKIHCILPLFAAAAVAATWPGQWGYYVSDVVVACGAAAAVVKPIIICVFHTFYAGVAAAIAEWPAQKLLLRFLIYARPNEFQFGEAERGEELEIRVVKVGISKSVHTHTSGCKLNVGVSRVCCPQQMENGKWNVAPMLLAGSSSSSSSLSIIMRMLLLLLLLCI